MMRIDFDILQRTLRKAFSPRAALAVGVVAGAGAGLLAMEVRSDTVAMPDKAACCTSAVGLGDTMISPAIGADKDFFEVPSSPPSAMFLLGNNTSMQDYPEYLPEVFTPGYYPTPSSPAPGDLGGNGQAGHNINTGCSDPALVAAMDWFDKSSPDPAKNGSKVYDTDSHFGSTPFFQPDQFYMSRGRRLSWEVEDGPWSLGAVFQGLRTFGSEQHACYSIHEYTYAYFYSPMMTECEQCLATKGWWRGPVVPERGGTGNGLFGPDKQWYEPSLPPEAHRKWILSGRVLNVRPPKFVVARKVLKDVIDNAQNVRMGVASFGGDRGWFDPPWVLEGLRPACDKSFPTINEEALNRPKLRTAVNTTRFNNTERAIGEALFGLGGYFSSQLRDNKWKSWFQQPINPGYGWPGGNDGETIDNPYTGQPGLGYGRSSDEWLKEPYPTTDIYGNPVVLPGQPWENYDYNERAVCFGCQVNSVIVLTDGEPKYDNSVPITRMMELLKAKGAKHPDGTPVTFNPANPATNPDVGGINYCDQFEKDPVTHAKYTKEDCDYTYYNWPTGLGVGNKNFMDDVSFFLANMDLRDDLPGTQNIRTYTIGYGDNSAMLQSIALAGKGKFYRANNSTELRNAIIDALGDLKQLSTSFASASISGVQTGGMQSSVYVPRFVPRRGRPYEGHLFRFFYFSEFAQGCQPDRAKTTAGDPADLNRDKDCDDTFFLDKPAGFSGSVPDISSFTTANIVQENTEGIWVKVNTATALEGGKVEGGVPAQPFWDLGETVGQRKASANCDTSYPPNPNGGRCIFTMIDRDKDGKFTEEDNPPIEFHEDNLEQLKSYLLASGDAYCATLFAKQRKGTWKGTPEQQEDCAKQLIGFVRGRDVFDYDGDSDFDEDRPCADNAKPSDPKSCKLADIFHSTPITVEPPVEPFVCSLGLNTQCTSTLYDDFSNTVTSEPLCASGGGGKPCYKPTPMNPGRTATYRYGAYDEFRDRTKARDVSERDRVVLVGSNGGMIHAIHAGSVTGRARTGVLDDNYDIGSGQEIWAFIPPDLLPKLGLMVGGHEYFVDGTAMVRDIWADGAPLGSPTDRKKNGSKEPEEFRTIAVITERGGGQRYTALDMTKPYEMIRAAKTPTDKSIKPFRWMFPNACDKESISMGQSWSNFAPKPPPIGAVRLKPSGGSAPGDTDRGYEERWVAVLNGGYSPDLSRGRGVYMVDAWTGDKLWAAEAQPGFRASSPYEGVLNQMAPVVASAALVDIGKAQGVERDLDGFFDTLVVGDMAGQGWTFRFKEPGVLVKDTTTNTEMVANWYGARSLEMQRQEGSLAGPTNAFQKQPIFHIAANVLQPETGWLRSFMGTGDRQHLRGITGSDCSADDLLACIRLKCNVKATFVGEVNGQKRTSVVEYVAGVLTSNAENWISTAGSACSASRMDMTSLKLSCPEGAYGSAVFPPYASGASERDYSSSSWCSGAAGKWTCDHINLNTSEHHDQLLTATELTDVATNRYFGFHAYGGSKRVFQNEDGAVTFDSMRVSDKPGLTCSGMSCSLVDVTIPASAYSTIPVGSSGETQRYISKATLLSLAGAKAEDPGWFIRYNNSPLERTASGSTVLAGVVFWSSFAPTTGSGGAVCSLSGLGDASYSWQADVITGLPDQASSFQVFDSSGKLLGYSSSKARKASAPPGEPAPIISLSKTGGIRYEVAMSSPGEAPTTETLANQANVTPDISWSEVPRNLHECRHRNAQACE